MTPKERPHDPRALELRSFTQDGGRLQGEWAVASLPRVSESLFEPPGDAVCLWEAEGEQVPVAGGEPEMWLHLRAQATVALQCQRCLQAMAETLRVDRRFRFVRDEAEAERLDEQSEDDVLALPARLDLAELLEDELLLSLPLVPRHDGECPEPLPAPAVEPDEEPAPHPFAALAALRKGGGPGSAA